MRFTMPAAVARYEAEEAEAASEDVEDSVEAVDVAQPEHELQRRGEHGVKEALLGHDLILSGAAPCMGH